MDSQKKNYSLEIVQVNKDMWKNSLHKVIYNNMSQKKKLHHSLKQFGPVKSLK